ncbi:MAG: stage II sporulation protein D, partial [Halanaerobiales bacterium]
MWSKLGILFLSILLILIIIPLLINEFLSQSEDVSPQLLKVFNHQTGQIMQMELEEYLRGVVAAEMPAIYHTEALKAQAVAARTYAVRQLSQFGGSGTQKYNGADLSTDYADCQAYISEEQMKEKWGFVSFFYHWAKINKAVEETSGQVLVHKNSLIEAVYHANSGGMTEAAEYVWGNQSSYLQSVDSPFDSLSERNFKRIETFSINDFVKIFNIDKSKGVSEIEILNVSKSGRVLEIRIDNKSYTGKEVRELLDLPSTKFEIDKNGSSIEVNTYGYGHGVGLSQDGANGLAQNGYDYQQILHHYYTDVEI